MSGIKHRGQSDPLKEKRKKNIGLEFSPVIEHDIIDTKTIGCIGMELINHLLYARSQLPMPLSMLSQMIQRKNVDEQELVVRPRAMTKAKKKESWMKNLSTTSSAIRDLFEYYDVRKVVLIIGSTIVSPKETFLIDLTGISNLHLEHSDRPNGSVVRKFLRNIVLDESISEMSTIPPQNLRILFSLNQSIELDDEFACIFTPNLNYQLPNRGLLHKFTISLPSEGQDHQHQNQLPTVDQSTEHHNTTVNQHSDVDLNTNYTKNVSVGRNINVEQNDNDQNILIDQNVLSNDNWYVSCLPMKGFR